MSGTSWAIWLGAAAAAFGLAAYLYRVRELPGRGRGVLLSLRGGVLALLLLLLFDPSLAGPADDGGARLVLLDASASMAVPAADGAATRWQEGVRRVRASHAGDVLLFGDAPRAVPVAALDTLVPADPRSRLLPALEAAAQAGTRRVTLITDGRFDDIDDVVRWLPRLGVELDVQVVGGDVSNSAITRVSAPGWVEAGQPLDIHFEAMTIGSGPDSLIVRALRDGSEAGRTAIPRPGPGRFSSGTVRVVADEAAASGYVRYDIVLDPGDVLSGDDVRHLYVEVSAQPAGIVIVSLRPDWETRFLYPVLERALGLPVRAFLRTGDAWVEQGIPPRAGRRARDADVLESLGRASLVVLQGADEDAPAAFLEATAAAGRLLIFASGSGRLPGLPAPRTTPIPADWYVSGQIPSSPIAAALAGIDVEDLPPLTTLRIPEDVPGAWAALNVNRGRRGASYPLAVGARDARRRWVIALGEGYWRWALRGGDSRAAYERLWSALGGWLLEDAVAVRTETVAPAPRVLEPGAPVRWALAATAADTVRLQVADSAGAAVLDTALVPAGADSATTRPLPPGRYRYAARATAGAAAGEATGEFTVEPASTENVREPVAGRLQAPLAEVRATSRSARSRPLHASAWPYVAIILLLCAEWILRRRWGLR